MIYNNEQKKDKPLKSERYAHLKIKIHQLDTLSDVFPDGIETQSNGKRRY